MLQPLAAGAAVHGLLDAAAGGAHGCSPAVSHGFGSGIAPPRPLFPAPAVPLLLARRSMRAALFAFRAASLAPFFSARAASLTSLRSHTAVKLTTTGPPRCLRSTRICPGCRFMISAGVMVSFSIQVYEVDLRIDPFGPDGLMETDSCL